MFFKHENAIKKKKTKMEKFRRKTCLIAKNNSQPKYVNIYFFLILHQINGKITKKGSKNRYCKIIRVSKM